MDDIQTDMGEADQPVRIDGLVRILFVFILLCVGKSKVSLFFVCRNTHFTVLYFTNRDDVSSALPILNQDSLNSLMDFFLVVCMSL